MYSGHKYARDSNDTGTKKASTPKPPHDDEEPEDSDEEDDIPQPAAPLSCCHVVHAPERPSEYPRRLRECVVLHTET